MLKKLVTIYDHKLSQIADDLNHARLIQLNFDIGTISDKQREALVAINKMRNKFAHEITYEPSVEDLKLIFKKASVAFEDMTDGISQGLEELQSAKSVTDLEDWVISELFIQICYDLHDEYHERGGDVDDF